MKKDKQINKAQLLVPSNIYVNGCCVADELELYSDVSKPHHAGVLHWHNHYELEMTLSGSGTEIINSSMIQMRRGEAHIICPADTHVFYTEGEVEFFFVQFERKHLSKEMYRRIEESKVNRVVYFDENTASVVEKIFYAINEINHRLDINDPNSVMIKEKLLDAALTMYFKCSEKNDDVNANAYLKIPIQRVVGYIIDNYQTSISTVSIAKHFGYNVAYFRRLFKEYTGMSANEYIKSLRIKHAAKALITTDLRVIDISINCGYTSINSFLRDFKNQYNITPSSYRSKYTK